MFLLEPLAVSRVRVSALAMKGVAKAVPLRMNARRFNMKTLTWIISEEDRDHISNPVTFLHSAAVTNGLERWPASVMALLMRSSSIEIGSSAIHLL